ncbi:MAG: type I 3-dehydroquinate dehydratase [Halobacteriaceae archaeon]
MDLRFDDFVLAAATADLADEVAARDAADAVEFRMDFADDARDQLAAYGGDLPLIATNRPTWEGGEATDEGRIDDLLAAAAHDAVAAVDVELATLRDRDDGLVSELHDRDARVVVSTHDFEATPAPESMRETLRSATAQGDVGKLAVTATDRADVLDLLSVTHELDREGERVATMAMGTAGRHSRAVAPLYGSRIGYAPVDPADATAPGQFDLETLASLVTELRPED